jgi:hypothetical protein
MHPFQLLPGPARRWLYRVTLVLTVLVGLMLWWRNLDLRTAAAPHGLLSLELSFSSAKAEAVVASWMAAHGRAAPEPADPFARIVVGLPGDRSRDAALQIVQGFAFALCWAPLLCLACLWGHERFPGTRAGLWLAWGVWAAAALDAVENALLLALLEGKPWTPLLPAASVVKLLLILYALEWASWAAWRHGRRVEAALAWLASAALLIPALLA